jgi:hypothetical protein
MIRRIQEFLFASHQANADGEPYEACHVVNAEPFHDVGGMLFHRLETHGRSRTRSMA